MMNRSTLPQHLSKIYAGCRCQTLSTYYIINYTTMLCRLLYGVQCEQNRAQINDCSLCEIIQNTTNPKCLCQLGPFLVDATLVLKRQLGPFLVDTTLVLKPQVNHCNKINVTRWKSSSSYLKRIKIGALEAKKMM